MLFLILLYCLKVVISSFEPFPSDFKGGSSFSTFGGGGGVCRKRRVWLILFVTEDIVVSYTSKVEIPVSRYL